MRTLVAIFILSLGVAAGPQQRSQMTWQGYVAGGAVLFIQGDRVDFQGRGTGSVDLPKFRFRTALPAAALRAQVKLRQGTGALSVLEQPSPENEYTLIVRLDAPGDTHEFYALEFFWNAPGNRRRVGPERLPQPSANR